jgi:hypothetical protein
LKSLHKYEKELNQVRLRKRKLKRSNLPKPDPDQDQPRPSGPAEQHTDFPDSDIINQLALDLDLISPRTPLLSDEERNDLGLLDILSRSQVQTIQLLGVETEMCEQESWNHDVSVQLGRLSDSTKKVPFCTSSELFDLRPTEPPAEFSDEIPTFSASEKGKQKETHPGERHRSIFNFLPADTREAWLGEGNGTISSKIISLSFKNSSPFLSVDPLPSMKIPDHARPFKTLMPMIFPELFGEGATHDCIYRDTLYDFLKHDLQTMTTKNLEGNFFIVT